MKIRLKLLLILLAGMILYLPANAQENLEFSLKEAQEYAMKNSYELNVSKFETEKARKDVWNVISTGLPQVSGSYDYSKTIQQPVWEFDASNFGGEPGEVMEMKMMPDKSSQFGLLVNQKIFDGSYIVGVQSAQVYLNLSKNTQEKTEIEIREAVAMAYYSVQLAEEMKNVLQLNEQNSKRQLEEINEYYKNGFREEQDVQQLEVIVRKANNEVLKAERELQIAKAVFKYVIGLPINSEVVLSEDFSFFMKNALLNKNENNSFDATSHIDYKILESQEVAQKKLLKLEKSNYLPRIDGFLNMGYSESFNFLTGEIDWFNTTLAGVSVKWNLFSSGQRKASINKAKIDLEIVETQKRQAIENLNKEYLSAVANYNTAIEKYKNDKENRDLSQSILDKTKIKFNNGIENSMNLTQAETQYIQALGGYFGSSLELLQARIKLEKILSKY